MAIHVRARKHISFFIFPEFADTFPTLSIVSTLVRRGFRVSYVTTTRFAANITELGAEFIRCPTRETGLENPFPLLTEKTLLDVTPFYEKQTPDLIVHDTVSFAGRILANRLQVPSVQVSPDFRLDKRYKSQQAPKFFDAMLKATPMFSDVLRRYGIDGDGFCFARDSLNVYFYPEIFQLDSGVSDDGCYYAGRCTPERPYAANWRPTTSAVRPTVLVSTSTLHLQGFEYFNMCVEALVDLGWDVILQLSENINPRSVGSLPPRFQVVQSKPQIAILPFVDLIICAAGMMTTMEAMYCGVPMLMITHGNLEPETYADNNVRLGIGRHLRKAETTASSIRNSVISISEDHELHARVRQIQRIVRADPGGEEVANRILQPIE